MKLVLKAFSSNEDFTGDCDYAFLDLTKEYAEMLLKRIEKAQRMKAEDSCFYAVKYWDASCEYFKYHDGFEQAQDANGKSLEEAINSEEYAVVTDFTPPEDSYARSDCDQAVVDHESVRWMCYPKHCDSTTIDTMRLLLDVIEQAAGRKLDEVGAAK